MLTRVGLVEASSSVRRGEGGGAGKGKKDTGYLYKAFMVACRALPPRPFYDDDAYEHDKLIPKSLAGLVSFF